MLRDAPNQTDALAIRARAHEGEGRFKEAAADLRRLVAAQLRKGEPAAAAQALVRLLGLSAEGQERSHYERRLVSDLYAALATANADDIERTRGIFSALRRTNPKVYTALSSQSRGDFGAGLFETERPGRLSADEPLPLRRSGGRTQITARKLVELIERDDFAELNGLRDDFAKLDGSQKKLVVEALSAAGGGDGSYAALIARDRLAQAVVVDASNAAWHGQEMIVGGRPRLSQIVGIRRALRERGHFPILLIGDASLPFVIDDPAGFRRMVDNAQIFLATSGSDADEVILREALRLNAYVVSPTSWPTGIRIRRYQRSSSTSRRRMHG